MLPTESYLLYLIQSRLNQFFTFRIQSWSCFIHKKDFRISNQSPGDGYSLLFAPAKEFSSISNQCVIVLEARMCY